MFCLLELRRRTLHTQVGCGGRYKDRITKLYMSHNPQDVEQVEGLMVPPVYPGFLVQMLILLAGRASRGLEKFVITTGPHRAQ